MNQLTMVINLIEQWLIKNKKYSIKKSLSHLYFVINGELYQIIKKINVVGKFNASPDIDKGTQYTLNGIIQTESYLGKKVNIYLSINQQIVIQKVIIINMFQ